MKFSANLSLLFTEVEWPERFRAARQAGFDAVEIQFPYNEKPETLRQALAENDLKLVLFNVDADDLLQGGEGLAAVPEKRNRFKAALAQTLDYIQVLKPEAVNVLPGCCFNTDRNEAYLTTFKENLLLAAQSFWPLGVKTVFEAINTDTMPGFIIHNGEQMLRVLEALQHPGLFMQYDIYHMHKMAEPITDFITRHADKIGHIQFADHPGRGQPGTGSIDFERIFLCIGQSGYQGWVGAEYQPRGKTGDSLQWFL